MGAVPPAFLLQMAVVFVPFPQGVFDTQALTAGQLALSLALSSIVFLVVEVSKWIRQRREE